jgi:hypothetical protein
MALYAWCSGGIPAYAGSFDGTGPTLHLPLDDGSPSTAAADVSGNALDAALTNMDPATDWVIGIDGMALDLDGTDDYAEIGDEPELDFGADAFSASYWFYKRSTSQATCDNLYGVTKWRSGSSPGSNEWLLNIGRCGSAAVASQTDQVGFVIESGTTVYAARSPDPVSLNEWHHLVGVRLNESMRLYLDGVVVDEVTDLSCNAAVNSSGRSLRIGANDPSGAINASDAIIDDVQIYRFALTDGDVAVGETAGGEVASLFAAPGEVITRPATTTTTTLVMCPADCGDANEDGSITATDALIALRTAVGQGSCQLCLCDTNDSASVTATDALAILRFTVGSLCRFSCPNAG